MKKIILGILIGIVTWGCLLSISDYMWILVSPGWYGKHQNDLQIAISQNKPYMTQTFILIIVILRSVVYSLISGFITATIANENFFSTLILGCLLVICGFLVNLSYWDFVPYWFHLLIFFQFIPFTLLGGRLVTVVPDYPKLAFWKDVAN